MSISIRILSEPRTRHEYSSASPRLTAVSHERPQETSSNLALESSPSTIRKRPGRSQLLRDGRNLGGSSASLIDAKVSCSRLESSSWLSFSSSFPPFFNRVRMNSWTSRRESNRRRMLLDSQLEILESLGRLVLDVLKILLDSAQRNTTLVVFRGFHLRDQGLR